MHHAQVNIRRVLGVGLAEYPQEVIEYWPNFEIIS